LSALTAPREGLYTLGYLQRRSYHYYVSAEIALFDPDRSIAASFQAFKGTVKYAW
jgi:hypothetical protein